MNDKMDELTRIFSQSTNMLFISHQCRTVLGLVIGGLLYYAIIPFLAKWKPTEFDGLFVALTNIELIGFVFVGLGIMHTPTILHNLSRKSELPEDIGQALEMIKQAEKSGVSSREIKKLRLELCQTRHTQ